MKFFISAILIALLSVAACLYLPWWSIAIVAFIVSVAIPQRPAKAFLAGFTALFVLWGSMAWYLSSSNQHLLAHKISLLLLKMDNPMMLILVTAVVGALVAGLASLSGSFVRREVV